ncbi:hydroxylysine kinase-like [Octopus sinensis]|uniref:Hydroxylysine kinase n=1 Tax=Octopus sinensis TaxID=2607531 RepID=A0A6P7U250_9MOLL|nr:hydroxylysine kinase-like [Octopus sinensis]
MSNSTECDTMNLVDYKPIKLPEHMIAQLLKDRYGMELIDFSELISYDDRNYLVHVTSKHDNPYVKKIDSNGYLLKIFNAEFSKNENFFDGFYSLSDHIRKSGVSTPERITNINGNLMSLEEIPTDTNNIATSRTLQHMVILQTFLPGVVISKVPMVPSLLYQFGKLIGSIHNSLKDFHHSYFDQTSTSSWSLTAVPRLKEYAAAIEDDRDRKLITDIVDAFIEEIIPVMPKFQPGQIHGDLSDLNVLVEERHSSIKQESSNESITSQKNKPDFVISGMIDFADASFSYFIYDIAIALAYMMTSNKQVDAINVSGHTLAGYLSEFHMNSAERNALLLLICCRISQTLAIGWYTYVRNPSNDYPLVTAATGWPLLHSIWKKPRDEIEKEWDFIIKSYEEH